MRIVVNMPQMAANGLSENWLFRHCGDCHWQELCSSLGAPSSALRDAAGQRLYPTFVAILARYERPLWDVEENDVFDTTVRLSHFGQSFFHSEVAFAGARATYGMEMLTAFASRESPDRNALRKSVPAKEFRYTSEALREAPPLLGLSKTMRRGDLARHEVAGHVFGFDAGAAMAPVTLEPNPYFDYNGANLLYFAAYPTLTDTIERAVVRREGLAPTGLDWALASSTVARDVFYYRNLEIGDALRGTVRSFERAGDTAFTWIRLSAADDDMAVADVFTVKRLVDGPIGKVDRSLPPAG
ncbi:MAG TPA: Pnap_2097 family protein [Anaeromyxobacteraceae bacterium]|nr:Pnap_2097 family protein [Anaeromyxobacteraceae bacterium]